jgi:hypothetical protein
MLGVEGDLGDMKFTLVCRWTFEWGQPGRFLAAADLTLAAAFLFDFTVAG